MNIKLLLIRLILGGCLSVYGLAASAQRITDFALLDQHGKFHQLSYYKNSLAVALIAVPENINPSLVQTIQKLTTDKQFKDVKFFCVTPVLIKNRQEFKRSLSELGIKLPVLIDSDQMITQLLNFQYFGEVILLDPDRLSILFRGSTNIVFETALQQLNEKKNLSVKTSSIDNLLPIDRIDQNNHLNTLSYAEDIAPIFIQHCVACHRDGGVAPFSMDSWGVVLGWSPMIKEVLLTKRMPPGQIDPTIGHFNNDRVLNSEDMQKIIRWIDEGGQNQDDHDPLEDTHWAGEDWRFGEPDLILSLPEQSIPATGLIDYTDLVLPITIAENRWVRATQFVPGDRRVLHHAEAFVLTPSLLHQHNKEGVSEKTFAKENFIAAYNNANNPDAALFSPYVPGVDPVAMPANTGGLLEKNSQLAIQLHYAAIGREIKDITSLGIWYYPKDQQPTDRMVVGCTCLEQSQWKNIPAYTDNFTVQADLLLNDNVYLYKVLPQLHYRGSSIRFDAYLPDGEQEALLSIPKYNYNWQIDYQFAKPKFLPKGTKIVATAVYDNSANNEFNPDPSQEVPWGRESYDEILAGVFQWKVAN